MDKLWQDAKVTEALSKMSAVAERQSLKSNCRKLLKAISLCPAELINQDSTHLLDFVITTLKEGLPGMQQSITVESEHGMVATFFENMAIWSCKAFPASSGELLEAVNALCARVLFASQSDDDAVAKRTVEAVETMKTFTVMQAFADKLNALKALGATTEERVATKAVVPMLKQLLADQDEIEKLTAEQLAHFAAGAADKIKGEATHLLSEHEKLYLGQGLTLLHSEHAKMMGKAHAGNGPAQKWQDAKMDTTNWSDFRASISSTLLRVSKDTFIADIRHLDKVCIIHVAFATQSSQHS